MITKQELLQTLSNFYGTEGYYKMYPNVAITDGVKFLADNAKCYWLIDIIWSYQSLNRFQKEEFQVFTINVNTQKHIAIVKATDGNDHVLMSQPIEYTTFPLEEMTLYYTNGIVLLPSEY